MKRCCIETRGRHRWHPSNAFFFFFPPPCNFATRLHQPPFSKRHPCKWPSFILAGPSSSRNAFQLRRKFEAGGKKEKKKKKSESHETTAYNNSGGLTRNRKRRIASRQRRRGKARQRKKVAAESNLERCQRSRIVTRLK